METHQKPPADKKNDRARLSLDLDSGTKNHFEEVRVRHGVSTLTDLMKKSVNCFDACMNQKKKGKVIFRDNDGSEQCIVFL